MILDQPNPAKSSDRPIVISAISKISPQGEVEFESEWYEIISAEHFWFQWRLLAALRQLRDLKVPLDRPLKALEIGCGTGLLRSAFEGATHWVVDGADRNMAALERCPSSRGKTFYYNIMDEHASLVEAYDIVILFDVLEHISDTKPFLTSVLHHLAPGGLLLINVPALQTLYSSYDKRMGHVRRYNRKTLAVEFQPFPVEIKDIRYWGITMLPLLAIRTLVSSFMKTEAKNLVQVGFKPSNDLVHFILRLMMRLELAVLSKPPLGTSLLLVAQKNRER